MSVDKPESQSGILSPEDMRKWLLQEIADTAKASELRIKEGAEIVAAYSSGQISPGEANGRFLRYDQRWGEALPGTHVFPGTTDEQLIKSIDEARSSQLREAVQARLRRDSGPNKPGL
jgi:hypothetical protein